MGNGSRIATPAFPTRPRQGSSKSYYPASEWPKKLRPLPRICCSAHIYTTGASNTLPVAEHPLIEVAMKTSCYRPSSNLRSWEDLSLFENSSNISRRFLSEKRNTVNSRYPRVWITRIWVNVIKVNFTRCLVSTFLALQRESKILKLARGASKEEKKFQSHVFLPFCLFFPYVFLSKRTINAYNIVQHVRA